MNTTTTFDPTPHLRNLKDPRKPDAPDRWYLEVKWRLVWLKAEHAAYIIKTELVEHDLAQGFALFKAEIILENAGSATGYGSETRSDWHDYIEKAETKAIGRALAALGFGTQFAPEFESCDCDGNTRPVDSPVEKPHPNGNGHSANGAIPTGPRLADLATPAQVDLIHKVTKGLGMTRDDLEEDSQRAYGRQVDKLTKREASQYVDALKAIACATSKRD